MSFGQRIRELRRKNNMTQEELAELLSISSQAVSRWETDAAMPDISFLVPLANLFGTTTDELLGRESGKKAEIEAYKEKSQVFANKGDVVRELALWREAAQKYPGDFECLEHLASSLLITLYSGGEEEMLESNAKEAVEICERIMRDCNVSEIRSRTLQTLVYLYSAKDYSVASEEKAVEYASMAASLHCSRENLLETAYFTEESKPKKLRQEHRNIISFLDELCMKIYYRKYDDPKERLFACETALKLWETVIYDGNYLFSHCRIQKIYEMIALCHAELGNADATLDALEKAFYHAEKFDSLPEGELKYTSVFVNFATVDTKSTSKNYMLTNTECARRFTRRKKFDFIRDNPRFIALLEE
jgi:transcriptional regulator with XRE-family HTH domain